VLSCLSGKYKGKRYNYVFHVV